MKPKTAIKALLIVYTAILLFHFAILLKLIPYGITWGGKLQSDQEMYVFESVSIFINLIFMFMLAMKGGLVKQFIPISGVNIILWVFFGLFCLNTVGNIFAETTFEKCFTIVTLGTAWLLWVVLKSKTDMESR